MRNLFLLVSLIVSLPVLGSTANDVASIRKAMTDGISTSATSDNLSIAPITTVSLSAVYNLLPANGRSYTAGNGSVTVSGRKFVAASGTVSLGYGTLQSFRSIRYDDGHGATIRAAARFPDPVASTWSGVGGFTIGDEVSFGYNGTTFGVWHRYGGKPEVQTLTVTGAASGGENATVTIDDTAYVVALTGGGTVQQDATEIAAYLQANGTGIDAEQVDDGVIISFQSDGDKTGTFSFSSATATATFAETTAGVTKTSNHVPQANWNRYNPPNLDPSKGNNYQIRYANAFGNIRYYVGNESTGNYELVHVVEWANRNTTENMGNPSLHVGCYAVSTGATTSTSVSCDMIIGEIDSPQSNTRNPRGYSNTKSIDTTATNILTVRTDRNYNGLTNQSEISPLILTLANDGSKSAIFEIRTNQTVGGFPNFQKIGTNLYSSVDVAGTTTTDDGRPLAVFTVAKGQSVTIDMRDISMPPTIRLVISGRMASGAAADLTAALTWYEDL